MAEELSVELGLGTHVERKIRRSLDVTDADVVLEVGESPETSQATVALSVGALSVLDTDAQQRAIRNAFDTLVPGTRIGIVEMCLRPDVLDEPDAAELRGVASEIFGRTVSPNTPSHWFAMIEYAGFSVVHRLDADLKYPRARSTRRLVSRRRFELGVVGFAALRD